MRHFSPQPRRLICTNLVPLILTSLACLCLPALADVYDEVEHMIRNGQLERAAQLSSRHLDKSPQDPQMRLLRSRILDTQGQTDEALALLQSLTLDYPELPEPHNNLAELYARQGRTQEAIDSLHKALLARPDYTTALENLGDLHLGLALQAYQRASQAPAPAASVKRKSETIAPLLQR